MAKSLYAFAVELSKQIDEFAVAEKTGQYVAENQKELKKHQLNFGRLQQVLAQIISPLKDGTRETLSKRISKVNSAAKTAEFLVSLLNDEAKSEHVRECDNCRQMLQGEFFAVLNGLMGQDVSEALPEISEQIQIQSRLGEAFESLKDAQAALQRKLERAANWGYVMQKAEAYELVHDALVQIPENDRDLFLRGVACEVGDLNEPPDQEKLKAVLLLVSLNIQHKITIIGELF